MENNSNSKCRWKRISKKIYCNIDTQVKVEAYLVKQLVQQNEPNTLKIKVKNGLKPNQKVTIRVITNGYNIKNILQKFLECAIITLHFKMRVNYGRKNFLQI